MMFQTDSRRPVMISGRSIERSRGVAKEGDTEESGKIGLSVFLKKKPWTIRLSIYVNLATRIISKWLLLCVGRWDTGCQFPMFQTGLGKPVAVSRSSVQKARAVLEGETLYTTGN
jgi:breast cancer 2 susceptibility protein